MARYGQKFKERVVARLLPPENSAVEAASQTVGISVTTLEPMMKALTVPPIPASIVMRALLLDRT